MTDEKFILEVITRTEDRIINEFKALAGQLELKAGDDEAGLAFTAAASSILRVCRELKEN